MGSLFGGPRSGGSGIQNNGISGIGQAGPIAALAPNSGIGHAIENDPISQLIFGKAYTGPLTATAGPWAGQGPSLAAANSGYGLNTSGNPALGGGGNSAQLNATFGAAQPTAQPAYMGAPAQRPAVNNTQGILNTSAQFANGGAR